MHNLLALFPEFKNIVAAFHDLKFPVVVNGAAGSFKAFLTSALENELFSKKVICILVPGIDQVFRWKQDLENILPERKVLVFEPAEAIPFEVIAASREQSASRLQVLAGLRCQKEKPLIVLAAAEALLPRLIPPEEWEKASLSFEVGKNYDTILLCQLLLQAGYERKDIVNVQGTFALRGNILDVYSFQDCPLRLEFWGDTLSSIRGFDPESQRSTVAFEQAIIWPAHEFIYKPEKTEKALARMQDVYKMRKSRLKASRDVQVRFNQRYSALREMALEGSGFSLHLLQPYFYQQQVSLLDYLPPDSLVILDDPGRIGEQWKSSNALLDSDYKRLLQEGRALSGWEDYYFHTEDLQKGLKGFPLLAFSRLKGSFQDLEPRAVISLTTKEMQSFLGRPDLLLPEVHGWLQKKMSVLLLVQTEARLRHLEDDLRNRELTGSRAKKWTEYLERGRLHFGIGSLSRGFEVPGLLAVVAGDELYGKKTTGLRRKRNYSQESLDLKPDFAPGAYVVHPHHGIGRFLGVKRINGEGETRDYLEVVYAAGDRLYVPVTQADIIQGYVGPEGHNPKISRLGGTDWNRTKQKVKKKVQELACNLLDLYARRKSGQGFAFSPDTPWQHEFEELFPFEETPDQLRAINEVKSDMEKPLPMDRLVCGDVGFGKTEVALRAAFKAVQDNKQVAVLVPTTVLAQQHFHTFANRFAGYPVRIEVLSRFRSPSAQRKTVLAVSQGLVDIVIGTHRLLSSDVKFLNLGLLVIDEEQRFGVNHKEKIKALRTNVDVLTLTATPIPRTLQMSLTGVRDLSLIETPPQERLPVQTYVLEYSPEVVRDAIMREIKRGGQIYYVHNRVQTIVHISAYLQSLVPEATFKVAHGQMKENELEKVMWDFFNKEFDCLVCTTIIENGLDLPNVNTLIVDRADQFGLSQLYQLRGRVGRSNRLAYAYFTFEGDKILSEQAEKRLRALEEFTEFGSGFKLALRDLEIRGAGNLLGPEQHGHVAAVGFDMFNQLLTEVIKELRGEDIPEPKQDMQNWDLQANSYLPDDYVPELGQKVEIYRRLALVRSFEEIEELQAEVRDRFGPLPEPVEMMFILARLRVRSREVQIAEVDHNNRYLLLRYEEEFAPTREEIDRWASVFGKRLSFAAAGRFEVRLNTEGLNSQELLEKLSSVLLNPFIANTKQWSVRN